MGVVLVGLVRVDLANRPVVRRRPEPNPGVCLQPTQVLNEVAFVVGLTMLDRDPLPRVPPLGVENVGDAPISLTIPPLPLLPTTTNK